MPPLVCCDCASCPAMPEPYAALCCSVLFSRGQGDDRLTVESNEISCCCDLPHEIADWPSRLAHIAEACF